jgi:hypothetical protein
MLYTGKVFYIELDGEGRHPVLHFGMTGTLQVGVQSSWRFHAGSLFIQKGEGNYSRVLQGGP